MEESKVKSYMYLHILLFIYSLGAVCSKMAGGETFLSFNFIMLYGLVLADLFIYAIVWQQILKHLPLVTAYANKAITVIWGLVWGKLIFKENITIYNIVGSIVIIVGIYMVVSENEN